MTNKEIIKITGITILLILSLFSLYLIFVRPHITGTYLATKKDCHKAYNCDCLKDNCVCSYNRFSRNKIVCPKNLIKK